jgi:hypothetical protein
MGKTLGTFIQWNNESDKLSRFNDDVPALAVGWVFWGYAVNNLLNM